jgi:hypothetical protein
MRWPRAEPMRPGFMTVGHRLPVPAMQAVCHRDLEADIRPPSDHGVRRPRAGGAGEPVVGLLRAGKAGSKSAADHITATQLALARPPGPTGAGAALHENRQQRFTTSGGTTASGRSMPAEAW